MKKQGRRKPVTVRPVFLETIPADTRELQEGCLYISMKYNTLVHRCPCGCGGLSEIGLHPATRSMIYDGENVSIEPSIGARALRCGSHYWITKNCIIWAGELDEDLGHWYDRKRRNLTTAYSKQQEAHQTAAAKDRRWAGLVRKARQWLGR